MKPNYTYNGNVLRILDGDTLDVEIELWKDLKFTARLRLAHINAPEVHAADPKEKKAGEAAKEALFKLVGTVASFLDPAVIVKVLKQEKFGRWLADVYIPNPEWSQEKEDDADPCDPNRCPPVPDRFIYINEWMTKHGYAKPYEGGKREVYPENPFEEADDATTP